MKLQVPVGPASIETPYFDWEADDNVDLSLFEDEEEVDLTDLFDRPPSQECLH